MLEHLTNHRAPSSRQLKRSLTSCSGSSGEKPHMPLLTSKLRTLRSTCWAQSPHVAFHYSCSSVFRHRDQSSTDILDLYNKMKTEFSSAGEEEVSLGVWACVKCVCMGQCKVRQVSQRKHGDRPDAEQRNAGWCNWPIKVVFKGAVCSYLWCNLGKPHRMSQWDEFKNIKK